MDKEVTDNLCEYEKIRLANIRERENLFLKLNILEAKKGLIPSKQKKKSSPKTKKKAHLVPTRSSLRLSLQRDRYVPRKYVEIMLGRIFL